MLVGVPASTVNGVSMHVPAEYAGILPVSPSVEPFHFESHCFRGLRAAIEPGAVVFDVGASFGVMTVQAAILVGANGHVVSFDGNPQAIQHAALLIDSNGLSQRVRQIHTLVGERSADDVPFFVVPGFASVSSTRNKEITCFHPDATQVQTRMIALDDFAPPSPDVIKIDIEGGEYQLIMGARRLLLRHHPDLIIETHALEIDGIAGSTLQLCQLLTDLGYDLWNLETNRPTTPREFAGAYATTIGNLLASRRLPQLAPRLLQGAGAYSSQRSVGSPA